MMKFLRSQSQTVLVVVLGVIGLGFLFYGNAGNLLTSTGGHVSNDYGRIDGDDLSVAELYDAVRTTRDSIIIHGQGDKLKQPGASKAVAERAWSRLLLLREADRLHITVSDQEIVDYIQKQPLFQKNGVYSPDVYNSRMVELAQILQVPSDGGVDALASTKALFENITRDDFREEATQKALFSGARSPSQDVTTQYNKYYGPVTVSYVTIDPKTYLATAQVTPAEIEGEYKANPTNPAYRTEEKRKVDYVLLQLTPEQAKLSEAQKKAAKDALGQKALDFALAFQPAPSDSSTSTPPPPDFITEASKRGLNPATTDFFAADTPPAGMAPSPSFNNAAFSLTKDNTTSKVVELDNGVAVLHLNAIQGSELRPLAEVKDAIEAKLKENSASRTARFAAQITAKLLQGSVKKGMDFKTAVASHKELKLETIPAFVPAKTPPSDERLQTIAEATISLKAGDVSEPVTVQSDNTLLIIHLDSRAPADPAGLADFEKRFRGSQDQQLQTLVQQDWANWKSKQPGTHRPPDLELYGSVE